MSGGDVLVQIDMPRGVTFGKTRAESNGRDIPGVFRDKTKCAGQPDAGSSAGDSHALTAFAYRARSRRSASAEDHPPITETPLEHPVLGFKVFDERFLLPGQPRSERQHQELYQRARLSHGASRSQAVASCLLHLDQYLDHTGSPSAAFPDGRQGSPRRRSVGFQRRRSWVLGDQSLATCRHDIGCVAHHDGVRYEEAPAIEALGEEVGVDHHPLLRGGELGRSCAISQRSKANSPVVAMHTSTNALQRNASESFSLFIGCSFTVDACPSAAASRIMITNPVTMV